MQQQYYECLRNGMALRGMLALPDNPLMNRKIPLALLLHGFTGSRNEFGFIYHRLAKRLAEEGIASLRFDFMGSGDSDGAFSDMSPLTEMEDTLTVLSSVRNLPFVDNSRIALNGMSMGGLVACLAAARHPDAFHCLSLWSPALCVTEDCQAGRCQDISLKGMEYADFIDFHGLPLGAVFQKDALSLDVYYEMATFHRPLQIIHGSADCCVPLAYSEKLAALLPQNSTLLTIPGAGHVYESIPAQDQLLSLTVSFLKAQLLS